MPFREFLYPAMILGILIPDLDSLLVFIADFFLNISLVKNTTTHSLFSILIIYFVLKLKASLGILHQNIKFHYVFFDFQEFMELIEIF